ncbi:hypothetical protein Ae406Ps2_3924 [Pseudonocardia sp. Ae406_Ps2]|nr:hypothetical protein Ae331Ps2_2024c [Pseudonocardia sp. Ae331_Ps2]OLM03924.1 hypothetical protein Ae406Ps2_3924 [Pseudonocardia sp. Ae406_Ps2]OLM11237.1 hypothetical protein Ae505Ps2_1360c [Pseudonocardia sp. Ae505_Ps2]OLM25479.1 hypothetical protein Ae706Ps2_3912 [Pseudonocardia sp. Ae706_Ps2]
MIILGDKEIDHRSRCALRRQRGVTPTPSRPDPGAG